MSAQRSLLDLLDEQELDLQDEDDSLQSPAASPKHDLQLQTIPEAAEESQQSMQRVDQDIQYLIDDSYSVPVMIIDESQDAKNTEKQKLANFANFVRDKQIKIKQTELQFQKLVQQQAQYLLQQQKEEAIMKKLEKTIKPSKLQQTVQELLAKELFVDSESFQAPAREPKAQKPSKRQPQFESEDQTVTSLKQQIEQFKLKANEDAEIIKTLKMQLKKLDSNAMHTSTSTQASKSDALAEENEKLKQELLALRQQFNQEKADFKQQLLRANRVQSGIQSQKAKQQPVSDKQQEEIEKLKAEITQQSCQFRNRMKELQAQLDAAKQTIVELKKEISKLEDKNNLLEGKVCQKATEESKLATQISQIKKEYAFDNQLFLLFPKHHKEVLSLLNFFNRLENMKNAKEWLIKSANKFFEKLFYKLLGQLRYVRDYLKFAITKRPIHHPSNQELVELAMKKIRASPNVLESQIQRLSKQNGQLNSLNQNLIEHIEKLEKKLEDQTTTYSRLDEIVRMDKIQLANNVMQRILKKKAEEGLDYESGEIPELKLLKEYCDLIYKSTQEKPVARTGETLPQRESKTVQKEKVPVPPKCSKDPRHQKRQQVPIKSQYYNK